VHDASHAAVNGAKVSGNWSNGATGSSSCVTNSAGQCIVSKGNLSTKTASVTFTVSSITGTGLSYTSTANHDSEPDSNGTTIVVKP
jgi:hypothetical protein